MKKNDDENRQHGHHPKKEERGKKLWTEIRNVTWKKWIRRRDACGSLV
jgi:Fe-S cluster biosynthesis and repair protein YggX